MVRSQGPVSLTIGKLAESAGVGVETVRFYQRRGLIDQPPRHGSVRRYGSDDLRRLRFIRHAQAAGFTLEQIRELLALDSTEDRATARRLALGRVAALDEQIAKLEGARDALKRLASDCAAGGPGGCPILRAFDSQPSLSRSLK